MSENGEPEGFEEALVQLETLVGELETGELSLEESLRNFERGVHLVRYCSERLQAAELRIRELEEASGQLVERDVELREDE
ncbi:MAG: exodeoxyribonuclease VII small subunit [Myxococcota bacterium]